MVQEAASTPSGETPADARAREIKKQMTDEERKALLVSIMGASAALPFRDERIPEGVPMSAGYVPGVPRLGIPALPMSDASLGITNQGFREGDTATALPSSLALAWALPRARRLPFIMTKGLRSATVGSRSSVTPSVTT